MSTAAAAAPAAGGRSPTPGRCRRTSSRWSPVPTTRCSASTTASRSACTAGSRWPPHLDKDADELFTLTGQCFDEYHRLFGIRYPFGDYHQVFVPEFNAGAMENPGCVTFADDDGLPGSGDASQRSNRANTVAHEMAHQWFGDLVTMRWWDDLWLNESFADYMGHRVCVDATAFTDNWLLFALNNKAGGSTPTSAHRPIPLRATGLRTPTRRSRTSTGSPTPRAACRLAPAQQLPR